MGVLVLITPLPVRRLFSLAGFLPIMILLVFLFQILMPRRIFTVIPLVRVLDMICVVVVLSPQHSTGGKQANS
jgi:hypothetical protein